MWRKHSLIYPVIFFLLLSISATLVVGYAINFAILEDVLRERMERQAQHVGGSILKTLEGKVQRLERFKDIWLDNARWAQDAGDDARLVGNREDDTADAIWKQLSEFFHLWGVDFVLLLDESNQVIQRMPADFTIQPSDLADPMRSQTNQGQTVWHLGQLSGSWQIMFFVPVKADAHHGALTLVFGQDLRKVVTQLLHENPNPPFVLADPKSIAAGATDSLASMGFQQRVAALAIHEGKPRMVFDSSLPTNLYYTPIAFLDQTFSLVVPVALDEIRQVLTNSRQRLIGSFLAIIVLLIGLGIVMERVLLRPLRRLREKAATMVSACSHEEEALYLNPDEQGNEMVMLEKAMEAASIKLYAHVSHLVNTKNLLEGFALKDPITTLGNQLMLDEFLRLTLGACKRKQRPVAVIFIVPDRIEKHLKDLELESYNLVVSVLADRLRKQMRGEDLAFRVQKNEFVAFAPECGDDEQILAIVHRLHHSLTQPYRLGSDREIILGIHMGIAVFPGAGEKAEVLLAGARMALEKAFKEGHPFAIVGNSPTTGDQR